MSPEDHDTHRGTPNTPGPAPSPPAGEASRSADPRPAAVHSPRPGTRAIELDVEVPGTPEKAWEMAHTILTSSEDMVNKLSERQRKDRTHYAEVELKAAEQRLQKSRDIACA